MAEPARAGLGKILGHHVVPAAAHDGAARRGVEHVARDQCGACALDHRDGNARAAMADRVAGEIHRPQKRPPAHQHAPFRRALDDIAADRRIRLDRHADVETGIIGFIIAPIRHVACVAKRIAMIPSASEFGLAHL